MSSKTWPMMRCEPRAAVLPIEVKGLLSWRDGRSLQVPFLVWDISFKGIGLLLSDEPRAGEIVVLTFGYPLSLTVECSIRWSSLQEPDYDFQEDSYRAGLKILQPGMTFQELITHIDSLRGK